MKKLKNTTLCYIRRDGKYLMLHRVKKKDDYNQGKWIGIGGKFLDGETPEDCLLREVREETGLVLHDYCLRGIVTFASEKWGVEDMYLYTADGFTGTLQECTEGDLAWVSEEEVENLPLWEGDRIFLRLLRENAPYFLLKLHYDTEDRLIRAVLDGEELPL